MRSELVGPCMHYTLILAKRSFHVDISFLSIFARTRNWLGCQDEKMKLAVSPTLYSALIQEARRLGAREIAVLAPAAGRQGLHENAEGAEGREETKPYLR